MECQTMMVESQSKLCLVEKKKTKKKKKKKKWKLKCMEELLIYSKDYWKVARVKLFFLSWGWKMVFTSCVFREMGNVLLSQARKCWFCWFWVCFIFLSFWKNQFIFSDGWCRPLFPLQLHPLTLSWNIKWVHKDEAFVSTALSPLSWYDAIPLCILTINRLWFAPGLFCFCFILKDSKIKAPFELGNVLLCLL